VGIAVVLFGLLPLAAARGTTPAIEGEPRARVRHYLRVATTLMLAGLMFGLINSSAESLLAVYGLQKGMDEGSATFMLLLLVLGAIMGQLPAGWLADHFDHLRILATSCLTTLVAMAMLPLTIGVPALMWPVMLTMGAGLGSFYVVALTMMGQRYRGAELISVNTSFVFVWGIGSAVGPGLSGGAMTVLGPDGMPVVGVALCAVFLAACIRQIRREGRSES
jgi:MFS family permease